MKTNHNVIYSDSKNMDAVPSESVDLMVTSPPYPMIAMWDEMRSINISEEIKSLQVPVFFIEGKYDMATPTILVEKYYDSLDAERGKKIILFKKSAHLPMIEEKEKYEEFLVMELLIESQK